MTGSEDNTILGMITLLELLLNYYLNLITKTAPLPLRSLKLKKMEDKTK